MDDDFTIADNQNGLPKESISRVDLLRVNHLRYLFQTRYIENIRLRMNTVANGSGITRLFNDLSSGSFVFEHVLAVIISTLDRKNRSAEFVIRPQTKVSAILG
jgi:hypothetical protein